MTSACATTSAGRSSTVEPGRGTPRSARWRPRPYGGQPRGGVTVPEPPGRAGRAASGSRAVPAGRGARDGQWLLRAAPGDHRASLVRGGADEGWLLVVAEAPTLLDVPTPNGRKGPSRHPLQVVHAQRFWGRVWPTGRPPSSRKIDRVGVDRPTATRRDTEDHGRKPGRVGLVNLVLCDPYAQPVARLDGAGVGQRHDTRPLHLAEPLVVRGREGEPHVQLDGIADLGPVEVARRIRRSPLDPGLDRPRGADLRARSGRARTCRGTPTGPASVMPTAVRSGVATKVASRRGRGCAQSTLTTGDSSTLGTGCEW